MESKAISVEEVLSFIDGWYTSIVRKEKQTNEEKVVMGVLNDIQQYIILNQNKYGKKESK